MPAFVYPLLPRRSKSATREAAKETRKKTHLESGFNDVGGRNERRGGHAGNGAGQQQRQRCVVATLVGQRRFAVSVRREVDGAERDVAQEARLGTLVAGKKDKPKTNNEQTRNRHPSLRSSHTHQQALRISAFS